jgi:hypothetical protein
LSSGPGFVRIASGEHQHEGGDGERGRTLAERLDAAVDQDRERQRAGFHSAVRRGAPKRASKDE